jgi:glycosyltransferase involved in cell wall biosynthesis
MKPIALAMSAYNRDPFIATAIQSIIDQSFQDWTLMIVDDASTDQTYAIAGAFEAMDRRINLMRNSENRGCGFTNNRAMNACINGHGVQFVGWVDSDDVLLPTALEKTIEFLRQHPQTDLVYTHYQPIDSMGAPMVGAKAAPYSRDRLLDECMVTHFHLMRAEAYTEVGGFDPSLQSAVDYDLMLRVSDSHQIDCLPEVLYLYRIHGSSMTLAHPDRHVATGEEVRQRARVRRQALGGD